MTCMMKRSMTKHSEGVGAAVFFAAFCEKFFSLFFENERANEN
jgi:hypothetical protein